jgi:hypothetical protein
MAGVGTHVARLLLLPTLFAALGLAAACGGGAGAPVAEIPDPEGLRGKIIGVESLAASSTLEVRYFLHETYGLDQGRDYAFVEAPAASLPVLLRDGGIDAMVLTDEAAFRMDGGDEFVLLVNVTDGVRRLTGGAVVSSVLITYPDAVALKGEALAELNRMLAASVTYFRANEGRVLSAIAADGDEERYLSWWWERAELALGGVSDSSGAGLRALWQAALTLGDIDAVPELARTVFEPDRAEVSAEGIRSLAASGDRVTVSLAVLESPERRAALYAIEQGFVTSDSVDLALTYVRESALMETPAARQYDVVEATPLIVPLGAQRRLDFVVLSAGAVNRSGTLLFVRADAP